MGGALLPSQKPQVAGNVAPGAFVLKLLSDAVVSRVENLWTAEHCPSRVRYYTTVYLLVHNLWFNWGADLI